MARIVGRLTALKVDRLKKPGLHPDGAGLYLQVTGDGKERIAKSWLYRFALAGKRRDMGLGSLAAIGLAEARSAAAEARKLVQAGTDPITHRDALRAVARAADAKAMTFAQCAEAYIEAHQAGWRNAKHRQQWRNTIATYAKQLMSLSVASIDTGLVLKVLEPIWTTRPETASRLRGRIEAVLDWAKTRGYRDGENPARWRGHLANQLPKAAKVRRVQHHPALPYPQLPVFMAELREQSGTAPRALEFTILTAARSGEALGARWAEFDLDGGIWTVPPDRMKAGREHRVALSRPALALLKGQRDLDPEFVFPGGRAKHPLSNMAMAMVLRRMERTGLTVHGFRSTFRDWCAERTNYPSEVAEMALAHTVGDKVEAAYRRGDLFEKRRRLAEDWARFCISGEKTGSVIPLKRKKG